MTKIYKYFIWFFMLTKRLLHQWSFLVLLCLIPCSVLLTNLAMFQESGIVHVILCSEDNDEKSLEIINSLLNEDSVIRFSQSDSYNIAKNSVINHKADAAWIFTSDFSAKSEEYISSPASAEPLITIIERESSIPLRIAKEKLFGAMYHNFSYSIYKNFVYSELVSEEAVPPQTAKEYYDATPKGSSIVKIERLDSTPLIDSPKIDYLTAPLRGILSLMVVLCTLTAAMFFLREQALGKFAWMSPVKRIVPAMASCFSAACLSAIAVFITIQFLGISTGILYELQSMALFVLSVTGFCMTVSTLFRSAGKFGAMIPGIMIIMLVLSPIFFNMKILRPVRLMLPTYYYLQSTYNIQYRLYEIIYCIATYVICFVLNKLTAEYKHHESNT